MKSMIQRWQSAAYRIMGAAALLSFSGSIFANNQETLTDLQTNISNTGGDILKIAMTIVTVAGIFLVIKGIVHLKQNYTGTGQERHLSKGLACLAFGALLFIAVPITHMLVGGLAGTKDGGTNYNTWTAPGTAQPLGGGAGSGT